MNTIQISVQIERESNFSDLQITLIQTAIKTLQKAISKFGTVKVLVTLNDQELH